MTPLTCCQCDSDWFACDPGDTATVYEHHLGRFWPGIGVDDPPEYWCFTCWVKRDQAPMKETR